MADKLNPIRYRQFINSDIYSLFLYILQEEKKDIVEKMTNEDDKEKLFILQKQLQALDKLPNIIQAKAQEQD